MYKEIIIFTAGLGIGAGVAYMYASKHFRELNERDIAELKAYYNGEFMEKLLKKSENEPKKDDSEKVMREQNSIDNSVNQYEKVVEAIKEPEIEEKLPKNEEKRVIISSDEFLEDENYDKETIYYYEEDETFCDPEYVVLPEAIDLIGKENLDHVGMFEDNVLYVRNELFGKDLEVIFHDGAYSDVVDVD